MIMMIVDEIFIPKRRIVIVNPEQIQHYISVYNGKKNIVPLQKKKSYQKRFCINLGGEYCIYTLFEYL